MVQNFSYETQGSESYLIYTFQNDTATNSLIVGMMSNNNIEGLLPFSYHQMGSARYARYNISSLISLKKLCEEPVKRKILLNIFRSIADAYINSEDYAIDPQNIVVDTQYLYVNPENGNAFMICVPCNTVQNNPDIKTLYKDIMMTAVFDRTENCSYIGQIELYLSSDSFNPSDFKKFINEIDIEEPPAPIEPVVSEEPVPQPEQEIFLNVPENNNTQNEISSQLPAQPELNTYNQPQQYQTDNAAYQPQNPSYGYEQQYQQNDSVYQSRYQNNNEYNQYQPQYPTDNNSYYQQQYSQENSEDHYQQQYQTDNNSYYQQQYSVDNNANSYQQPYQTNNSYNYQQQYQNNNDYTGYQQYATDSSASAYQQQYPTDNNTNTYQQQYSADNHTNNYSQPYAAENNSYAQQVVQPSVDPYGETTVLGASGYNETTVLGGSSYENMPAAYLIRHKNGERVLVNKDVFHIGKEKSIADYFISDNSAISRKHAEIVKRNNEYYIIDTNSTNHIYVNGIRIPCNVETHIISGTEIILADERFDFVIM